MAIMFAEEFDRGPEMDETSREGEASQPNLIELIQLYALRQDPVTLTIESALCQLGWLCIEEGDVVRAYTAGGKEGFKAFVEIISWDGPHIANLEREVFDEPNIDVPLSKLLIEAFWESEAHESDEPPCDSIPEGLEEDTVTGKSEFGPPDGVTKVVIETAQRLSQIKGFVAVALVHAPTGKRIETLGHRSRLKIPAWLECVIQGQSMDSDFEEAVFTTREYIDVFLPPVGASDVAYLLRMDREKTNRGMLEVGLRRIRERDES